MAPKAKKVLNIEDMEVEDALRTQRVENSSNSNSGHAEQLASSEVVLKDGTSLDLTALINASIQSFMAKKLANEQQNISTYDKPGTSGTKRSADVTHFKKADNKRLRVLTIDETGQCFQNESESENEYDSEEDNDSSISSIFGAQINSVDRSLFTGKRVASHDERSEMLESPSRDQSKAQDHDERSESLASPSRGSSLRAKSTDKESSHLTTAQGLDNVQKKGEVNINDNDDLDKDLYIPSKSSPNWNPPAGILKWANKTFDYEWDSDQVKEYESKYVAPKEYTHLFTPIPLTKAMDQALNSQYTKDTDFIFNRRETERFLFRASRDICASYGPFFQVLALLGEKGNCKYERAILSEGVLGIASAMNKITRARRELLRRYFKLDVAKVLYTYDPSHSQFFGGNSLDERVKEAKELASAQSNLFFRPKPKTTKSYSKPYTKSSGFQQNQNNQQKTQYKGRQSRGRGRRGKGKSQNSSATASNSK